MTELLCVLAIILLVSTTIVALRLHEAPKESTPALHRTEQRQSRIMGGEVAAEASAPWQVSIQNQYMQHFCGGAIIADQYVLTAASCVAGLQKRHMQVVTSTNDWAGFSWRYDVDDIIVHCNFDKPLYHNDIALLKLRTLIAYDEKTQNITIDPTEQFADGEALLMTGWGSWKVGEFYPEPLKQLQVNYVSAEKCRQAFGSLEDLDELGHLCTAADVGEGACHGDTGGPLINDRGHLVGIGNWGVPCGLGFPDVFARLSFYYDWIMTTISGCDLEP